ncbi:hypothetical protein HS088_TW10G00240 [Tripterygium wilfordii]|uniref:Uncharacterized protein n=1 Tax=Tripterygium wilfordii TaxID=458696 RepID=A0A7J7D4G9_TRIWF|nr:hypothetical protein HS088_TW10G00240 [Tripterygium wilfordii]
MTFCYCGDQVYYCSLAECSKLSQHSQTITFCDGPNEVNSCSWSLFTTPRTVHQSRKNPFEVGPCYFYGFTHPKMDHFSVEILPFRYSTSCFTSAIIFECWVLIGPRYIILSFLLLQLHKN